MGYLELLKEFGVPMGLVVLFTVQGWRREKRLTRKIDLLETWYRQTLLTLVTNSTEAIADNTIAIGRMKQRLDSDAETQATLMELVKDATHTIAANTAALQR